MPLRVVAGRVSVNVGIAQMNRDIIPGDGDTIFVAGFTGGSNLDRLIFRRFEINSGAAMSSPKKKKEKDRCPRSHGAVEGTAWRKCCKGEKASSSGLNRLGERSAVSIHQSVG